MGSVDTTIHDRPTGRAEHFANAHSSPHPLILYGGWFCPFVQRSWIVLHEKKIPHQYTEINPYHKAPEFLALNPRGLVPTLAVPVHEKHGKEQRPLFESTVICEYLDEVYRDPAKHGEPLLPADDAYERARCRIWMDFIGSRVVSGFYRFMQHTPDKSFSLDEARQEFLGHLKTLTKEADPVGPFFLGERFSMVDVLLAPWVVRLYLFDHYKEGGLGVPEDGEGKEDEEVWKRWRKWAEAIKQRQSVLDTSSEKDSYVDAYKRYAEDTTQSEVAKATRGGRGLP